MIITLLLGLLSFIILTIVIGGGITLIEIYKVNLVELILNIIAILFVIVVLGIASYYLGLIVRSFFNI